MKKKSNKKNGKVEYLLKCVTRTAEHNIKSAAEQSQHEHILLKVRGIDLIAREAHYHPSCRKDFTRGETHIQKSDPSKS